MTTAIDAVGRKLARLAVRFVAVGAVALATSGCATQLGSFFGSSQDVTASVDNPVITQERSLSLASNDMSASSPLSPPTSSCPPISVWRGDAQLTIYEIGRVGDNLAIEHRGEITKTARECEFSPGEVTVKFGIAGRVLLGPLGHPGVVKLPLLVNVTDASRQKIKTEKVNVSVDLVDGKPYGNFSTVQRVSFPLPQGANPGDYNLFVTFDRNAPGAG